MARSPIVAARIALLFGGVAATSCSPNANGESTTVGPKAHAATSTTCTPPVPADTSEVRATILDRDGSGCVAFVDEELSPIHATPTIWRRRGDTWARVETPFDPETAQNQGWAAVASADDAVVAALDSRVESTGWELTIVRSSDGGATWAAPVQVTKPYYLASLQALRLDPGGVATVVVLLDEDYGAGVEPGLYRHHLGGDAGWVRTR